MQTRYYGNCLKERFVPVQWQGIRCMEGRTFHVFDRIGKVVGDSVSIDLSLDAISLNDSDNADSIPSGRTIRNNSTGVLSIGPAVRRA